MLFFLAPFSSHNWLGDKQIFEVFNQACARGGGSMMTSMLKVMKIAMTFKLTLLSNTGPKAITTQASRFFGFLNETTTRSTIILHDEQNPTPTQGTYDGIFQW